MKYLATILMISIQLIVQAQSYDEYLKTFRLLSGKKMYAEADSVIREGLALFPNDHDMLCSQARLAAWQSDYENAERIADTVLYHYPQDHEAFLIKISISHWSGKNEKLLTQAQEFLTIYPKDVDFWYYEAYAYYQMGMIDKSLELVDQLLDSIPTHEASQRLEISIRNRYYNFAETEITYTDFSEILDPWKQIRIGYGQNQKLPWNVHLTGVERFSSKGWSLQAETYPQLHKKSYAFIEATYSPNSFMANYTAGLEVFQGFGDFEFSLGSKHFSFSQDKFFLHKASLGLYKKAYFAHYQILYNQAQNVDNYTHILRLRTNIGANHSLEGEIISGTNVQEYVNPEGTINLMTHKSVGLKYAFKINDLNSIHLRARARNEEYRSELFRTRVDIQVGYRLKMY